MSLLTVSLFIYLYPAAPETDCLPQISFSVKRINVIYFWAGSSSALGLMLARFSFVVFLGIQELCVIVIEITNQPTSLDE